MIQINSFSFTHLVAESENGSRDERNYAGIIYSNQEGVSSEPGMSHIDVCTLASRRETSRMTKEMSTLAFAIVAVWRFAYVFAYLLLTF